MSETMTAEQHAVDELNARFYGHFPFPWDCLRFDYCADPMLDTNMLRQAIGDWSHTRVPAAPDIWVAGCGTNQAIFMALRFPNAHVVASDLSCESLHICRELARQLRLTNLTIVRESINEAAYRDQFDYVVSTGVIHHNADPAAALARLTAALKPSGVLELMVYNRFHRSTLTALQESVRILREPMSVDLDGELEIARRLLTQPLKIESLEKLQRALEDAPPARLADALIQPVEYSYTVESLEALANGCGLVMLWPCASPFDRGSCEFSWFLEFTDADLRERYAAIPDSRRWQLLNLLLRERSPMLWFYLQRADSPYARKPERVIDQEFLGLRCTRVEASREAFVRRGDGTYARARSFAFPGPPAEPVLKKIWEAADGTRTVEEIFWRQGVPLDAGVVNRARLFLTTPRTPHLLLAAG
jgi:SAM-dependent methyltransferase